MATIGLSRPMAALYGNNDTAVSYTKGTVLGKAITFSSEIEQADDNNLYGDNGIAESDRSFSSGTLTIGTDDLTQEASALILGITPKSLGEGDSNSELVYDDDMNVPYMGFGCVVKKKRGGLYKWRAVVFPKIMFDIPPDAADTQGETIEWQTPELTATILRDDSEKHRWKMEATFGTEAEAVEYIKGKLGMTTASEASAAPARLAKEGTK